MRAHCCLSFVMLRKNLIQYAIRTKSANEAKDHKLCHIYVPLHCSLYPFKSATIHHSISHRWEKASVCEILAEEASSERN